MKTKTTYRASASPAMYRPGVEIRGFVEELTPGDQPRVSYIKQALELVQITPENDGHQIPAFMTMTLEEAQNFMDQLYDAGIKPTAGAGSIGQLSATQAHLEDMRKLTFQLIGKP